MSVSTLAPGCAYCGCDADTVAILAANMGITDPICCETTLEVTA